MGIIKLITDHWEAISSFCTVSFFVGKWVIIRGLKLRKAVKNWVDKVDNGLAELKPNGGGSINDKVNKLVVLMGITSTDVKFLTGRQESLLDELPYPFYQNDEHGTCTFVNKSWIELTGLPREQAIGHGWVDIIHPDDLPTLMKRGEDFIKFGGKDYDGKFRIIHWKTKDVFNVHCTASKLRDKDTGKWLGVIGKLEIIEDKDES